MPGKLNSLLAAWRSGDLPKLEETMVKELSTKYPAIAPATRPMMIHPRMPRSGMRSSLSAALEVHDPSQPVIVTHTGVSGAYPHWRNIDDAQIRAIADRGGVVGVLYHSLYLARVLYTCSRDKILDHLEQSGFDPVRWRPQLGVADAPWFAWRMLRW